jgi:hypothetical protein
MGAALGRQSRPKPFEGALDVMTLIEEANRIGLYLLGRWPSPQEAERYLRAHQMLDLQLDGYEASLLRLALSNRLLSGMVDGGLAVIRPTSAIRRKFFVMLAILEASPQSSRWFLHEESGWGGLALLAVRMAWAGVKGLMGCAFLALHKLSWTLSSGCRRPK